MAELYRNKKGVRAVAETVAKEWESSCASRTTPARPLLAAEAPDARLLSVEIGEEPLAFPPHPKVCCTVQRFRPNE